MVSTQPRLLRSGSASDSSEACSVRCLCLLSPHWSASSSAVLPPLVVAYLQPGQLRLTRRPPMPPGPLPNQRPRFCRVLQAAPWGAVERQGLVANHRSITTWSTRPSNQFGLTDQGNEDGAWPPTASEQANTVASVRPMWLERPEKSSPTSTRQTQADSNGLKATAAVCSY